MQSHEYGADTHLGNARENNEDTFVCATDKALWIVADGMGGLGFGEAASAITAYTITTLIKEGHGIYQAIGAAHTRIKEYAETEAQGTNMGTTLVLLFSQGSVYNVFWVGDSRGYLFNGTLRQITRDHSLVQALIDQGELTEEEALYDPRKNAITMALGVRELDTVRADTVSEKWRPGDKILLCSDGLSDSISHAEIEKGLQEGGTDQEIVQRLIERALAAGGRDNITVVLVSAPAFVTAGDSDTEVPDEEVPKTDNTASTATRDDSDTNVLGKPRSPAATGDQRNSTLTRNPSRSTVRIEEAEETFNETLVAIDPDRMAGGSIAAPMPMRNLPDPGQGAVHEGQPMLWVRARDFLKYIVPLVVALLLITLWAGVG